MSTAARRRVDKEARSPRHTSFVAARCRSNNDIPYWCMSLPDVDIDEFRALYLARFGVVINSSQAEAKLEHLIELITLLYELD